MLRRRFAQAKSPKERLLKEAEKLRDDARHLPFGPAREAALRKARHTEAAAHMDDWLNSQGLQAPKRDTPDPLRSAERVKRFRHKAAEAEQLIDLAQTERRRQSLRQIADNYNRTADQLEELDKPKPKM